MRAVADGLITGAAYSQKDAKRRAEALAEVLSMASAVDFKELRQTLREQREELESDPESMLVDLLAKALDEDVPITDAGDPDHTFFGIDVFVALTVAAADVARVAHRSERHDLADELLRRLSGLALSIQRQAPSWEPGQAVGDVISNLDYPDRPVSMLYLHEDEVDILAALVASLRSFLSDAEEDAAISVPRDLIDLELLGHGGPARARAGCTCTYCYADAPEALDAPTVATFIEGTAQQMEEIGKFIWDDSRPALAQPFSDTPARLDDLTDGELRALEAELEAELGTDPSQD